MSCEGGNKGDLCKRLFADTSDRGGDCSMSEGADNDGNCGEGRVACVEVMTIFSRSDFEFCKSRKCLRCRS